MIDSSYHNQYDDMNQLSDLTNHFMIGTIIYDPARPEILIIS